MPNAAPRIRAYREGDGAALSALYLRSVEALGPRHYTAAQVAVWAAGRPSPERFDAMSRDGRTTLVAVDRADSPLAFADLEADGHIDYFYAAPEAAGTGTASALYEALETIARDRGLVRLFAEASEVARHFFVKRGFTVVARRDFELSGVPMYNYAVVKILSEDADI